MTEEKKEFEWTTGSSQLKQTYSTTLLEKLKHIRKMVRKDYDCKIGLVKLFDDADKSRRKDD